MKTSFLLQLPVSLLLLLEGALSQQVPYNSAQILLSPQDAHVAYILKQVSASGTQFSLSSADLTGSLDASNLKLRPISGDLDFLQNASNQPWNAVIDNGGNITVYTGSCGGSGAIWKLATGGSTSSAGEWVEETLSQEQGVGMGPQYLSSAIAFSSNASSGTTDTEYFFFGGLCPWSGSTTSNWQANGQYSKSMVSLVPNDETDGSHYRSEYATTRNLPIAQAGQSLTALQPTFTNRSDDSQARQQDFVLLGGHTQEAFINMSQVALWSLPQKAWTYFPVAEGDTGTRTDLAVRQAQVQIEPRSGHTATLSTDGTKIVVLGGWVGDISTPAQPQVAILNVAGDYGGSGEWSWSAPQVGQQHGLGAGAGIFGHGAIMLPGDVLLVTGGYSIASRASKTRRQQSDLSAGSYLLNISSGDWLPSYSIPESQPKEEQASAGPLSKTSQKAGLGIGLGFGAVAILALVSFYLWYTRRNARLREEKEKEIQELEYNPHRSASNGWNMIPAMGQYSIVSPTDSISDRDAAARQTQVGWRTTSTQAERTGLLVELPSPTRGLRRHVSGKAQNPYDKRRSQNMEVIEERQDQESSRSSSDYEQSDLQRRTAALLDGSSRDPFSDSSNPLRRHPVYGALQHRQSVSERDQEVQQWRENWEKAAEALMHAPEMSRPSDNGGRSSPSKSDRTTSMLSESSVQSSWSSNRSTGPGLVRNLSTRSAALLSSFAATLAGSSTTPAPAIDARATLPSQQRRRRYSFTTSGAPSSPTRTRPDTANSTVRNDGDSYSTAKTSFAQLQAEGEALLGGNRSRGRSEPSSPIKEKKNEGWLGGVKRVISGARNTSMTANVTRTDAYRSGSSSPQKPGSRDGEQLPPRRATSDASFLRSRRGAQDWKVEDEEAEEDSRLQRPSVPHGEHDDDWDVERAAEDRVVQLMFTVPRQRLRVVNADDGDGRSLLSQDDRAP